MVGAIGSIGFQKFTRDAGLRTFCMHAVGGHATQTIVDNNSPNKTSYNHKQKLHKKTLPLRYSVSFLIIKLIDHMLPNTSPNITLLVRLLTENLRINQNYIPET